MRYGTDGIIEQLIQTHGLDPNSQNKEGDTPLHACINSKVTMKEDSSEVLRALTGMNEKLMKSLIKNGADPTIKNEQGESVIEFVEKMSTVPIFFRIRKTSTADVFYLIKDGRAKKN